MSHIFWNKRKITLVDRNNSNSEILDTCQVKQLQSKAFFFLVAVGIKDPTISKHACICVCVKSDIYDFKHILYQLQYVNNSMSLLSLYFKCCIYCIYIGTLSICSVKLV